MVARVTVALLTAFALGVALVASPAGPTASADPSAGDPTNEPANDSQAGGATWADPAPDALVGMTSLIARIQIDSLDDDGDGTVAQARIERVFKGDAAVGDTVAISGTARWTADATYEEPTVGSQWYAMLFARDEAPGSYATPSATIGFYRVDSETPPNPIDPSREVVWASLRDSWPLAPFLVADFEQWLALGVGQFNGVMASEDELRAIVDRLRTAPLVPPRLDEVRVVTDQVFCLELLALAGEGRHVGLVARLSRSISTHVCISVARALGWLGRAAHGDDREMAARTLLRLATATSTRLAAEALLGLDRCSLAWPYPAVAGDLIAALASMSPDPVLVHERVDPSTQPPCPAVNRLEPPRALAYRAIEGLLGAEAAMVGDVQRTDRKNGITALLARLALIEPGEAVWALPPIARLSYDAALLIAAERLGDDATGWPWSDELATAIQIATGQRFDSAGAFVAWQRER